MIKNVLVATDGSDNSIRALDFALDLAEKFSAKLIIINVSESPALTVVQDPTMMSPNNMIVFSKEIDSIHQDIIDKAVAHAKQVKPTVSVVSKLRQGNPASEIIAETKEGNVDIVVVGHKGVGKVKEFLGMGGISEKVVHLAPCPVVIVR